MGECRTLVTGATGLLGNNVVRALLARGDQVRVLSRPAACSRPLALLAVERVEGDVCDEPSVRRACHGVDLVIHAAARVHIGWTGLEQHQRVNVEGTRHVARAARQAGARLVHVSSVDTLAWGSRETPGDEGSPVTGGIDCPYFVTKRGGEQVVREEIAAGLDAVIVHPAYMMGPWDWKPSSGRMLLEVARGRAMFAPPGGNDFCDVRDVAWGIVRAAERGVRGRNYILGGEPLSYLEAWNLFARLTGAPAPLGVAGRWLLRTAGLAGNLVAKVSGWEPDVNTAATAASSIAHHFSSARAAQELGYRARPAAEAAAAAWEWFQEQGYIRPRRYFLRRRAR